MNNIISKVVNKFKKKYKQIKSTVEKKILNSNWYYSKFPHLYTYRNIQQELDVISLGSSPAKFAIDFSEEHFCKGANLAILPETIYYDFQVLKNYHSYLKNGGTILFVLCPFTFCKDKYRTEEHTDIYLNLRYYPILHRAMIDNFDPAIYEKWVKNPLKIGKEAWKRLLKDSVPYKGLAKTTNNLSDVQMEESAQKRIEAWKHEFNLSDLKPSNLPELVKTSIQSNINIFKEMKAFAEERGYNCMVVIPPFSKELTAKIPSEYIDAALMNPIKEIGIQYISYIKKPEWMKKEYYQDAFLMNFTGRKTLTHDIISKMNF